jgi:hypothetical protein
MGTRSSIVDNMVSTARRLTMRVGLLLFWLIAGARLVLAEETQWLTVASLAAAPGWDEPSAVSIGPDAQALVFRRDEQRNAASREPTRHELVFLNLATQQVQAVLDLPNAGYVRLGVSRDGHQVAVLHTLGGADWQPFVVSVWSPDRGDGVLKEFGYPCYELVRAGAVRQWLDGTPFGAPVFSPDGGKVTFFARHVTQNGQGSPQGATDSVAVLDLAFRTSVAFDLPFLSGSRAAHHWFLGWNNDGSVVYAVADDAEPRRMSRTGTADIAEEHSCPGGSIGTLFRCTLVDGRVSVVGRVPLGTVGFGEAADIVVARGERGRDRAMQPEGRGSGFSIVPIARLEHLHKQGEDSVGERVLDATIAEVKILGGENSFGIGDVFAGKAYTFVVGWLNGKRVVLRQAGGP